MTGGRVERQLSAVLAADVAGYSHRDRRRPAAIEALEAVAHEVAILDFALPGMNGTDVARRLRERLPDLPVIFASGYSETDAVSSTRGERSRMLRKPFKVDEL